MTLHQNEIATQQPQMLTKLFHTKTSDGSCNSEVVVAYYPSTVKVGHVHCYVKPALFTAQQFFKMPNGYFRL